MQDWIADKDKSVMAFEKIKNTVLPKLISGEIISIEKEESGSVLAMMDIHSGIDLVRKNEIGLQGIAWRAQWEKAYNTFTIRAERTTGTKTELEKRLEAIEKEYFYPAYTIQAYFDNDRDFNWLSVGIIRTRDLYETFIERPDLFSERTVKSDGNKFYVVNWNNLPTMKTLHYHDHRAMA
jgi:hypothetical protein